MIMIGALPEQYREGKWAAEGGTDGACPLSLSRKPNSTRVDLLSLSLSRSQGPRKHLPAFCLLPFFAGM